MISRSHSATPNDIFSPYQPEPSLLPHQEHVRIQWTLRNCCPRMKLWAETMDLEGRIRDRSQSGNKNRHSLPGHALHLSDEFWDLVGRKTQVTLECKGIYGWLILTITFLPTQTFLPYFCLLLIFTFIK